jgi:peptide/nickel transport system ATP-binding protein
MAETILDVRDLTVTFDTDDGTVHAVDGVSYTVGAGETLGIVGESGSGKSVSSLTVMGLTRSSNARITGEVHFGGRDLLKLSDEAIRGIRGSEIAMIFQDPLSSLHPFYRVGDQLAEAVRAHHKVSKGAALDRAVELLGRVGIPEPRRRADAYPHEFSGGMRQRAMIAMALINDPRLLIADEPTTALDVTVQAQILELFADLQSSMSMAILLVTHDVGVADHLGDDVGVMYAGRIVERGPTREVLDAPAHPYTRALLESLPEPGLERGALKAIPGRAVLAGEQVTGCPFAPRCPHAVATSWAEEPDLVPVGAGRAAACSNPAALSIGAPR